MTKTITLTYTIDVEEMTAAKIYELVYATLDVGLGLADLQDIDIGDDE